MITIQIPGSKSYTNRALILAALRNKETIISNYLQSDDTAAMIDCLRRIGVHIDVHPERVVVKNGIQTISREIDSKHRILDCRMSGTTIRFLTSLCCLIPGTYILDGEKRLTERPIGDLVSALTQAGAEIEYMKNAGFPPLQIKGDTLDRSKETTLTLSGAISSQFLTSLLMIAPIIGTEWTIEITDELVSKSYANMTLKMMKDWGVSVHNNDFHSFTIPPSEYSLPNDTYIVEGDYSGAGYFFAIAALTRKSIRLANLNPHSVQGDHEFPEMLTKHMQLEVAPNGTDVVVTGHGVRPVNVNMEHCPDQAQTMAVLCAFAKGKSILTGVRSLRVKETERVHAIQNELGKMGIQTESPDIDTLIIHGGVPRAASIDTYNDHRMAMSFAVAQTMLPNLKIMKSEVVKKTFPGFWDEFKKI